MVSQSVPNGTVLHPCARHVTPTHHGIAATSQPVTTHTDPDRWYRRRRPEPSPVRPRTISTPTAWYRRASRAALTCIRVKTQTNPQNNMPSKRPIRATDSIPTQRMVSSKRPNCQQTTHMVRQHHTPTAWYRRSVPSETEPTPVCLSQPDPQTTVSPERPVVDSGHPPGMCGTWPLLAVWDPKLNMGSLSSHRQESHLECAAPGNVRLLAARHNVGFAVSAMKNSAHQCCKPKNLISADTFANSIVSRGCPEQDHNSLTFANGSSPDPAPIFRFGVFSLDERSQ